MSVVHWCWNLCCSQRKPIPDIHKIRKRLITISTHVLDLHVLPFCLPKMTRLTPFLDVNMPCVFPLAWRVSRPLGPIFTHRWGEHLVLPISFQVCDKFNRIRPVIWSSPLLFWIVHVRVKEDRVKQISMIYKYVWMGSVIHPEWFPWEGLTSICHKWLFLLIRYHQSGFCLAFSNPDIRELNNALSPQRCHVKVIQLSLTFCAKYFFSKRYLTSFNFNTTLLLVDA